MKILKWKKKEEFIILNTLYDLNRGIYWIRKCGTEIKYQKKNTWFVGL